MKRLFLLVIAALLLIGCSDYVPTGGLTNMVSQGWDEGVAAVLLDNEAIYAKAEHVWTDMRPLANTNLAQVSFRIEMAEDALKMGGDGPFYLYGGGVMQVEEADFTFKDQTPISAVGAGQVAISRLDVDKDTQILHTAYDLHIVGLTAQIDGLMDAPVAVSMFGTATTGGVQSNILTQNENITTLKAFQCTGRMIPDSNMANLTYIGETEKGQELIGAGIGLLYDQPAAKSDGSFDCTMEGTGGVTYRSAIEGIEGTQLVDLAFEGLKVQGENEQTSAIYMPHVLGFIIGDGGSMNFNIGMPPT